MDVTLSWHEVMTACLVGVMRQVASLRDKRQHIAGMENIGWTEHIEGACGEAAVAKAMNVYWSSHVNNFDGDDLPGIQIRTRRRHDWDLIVRPNDDDNARWVLVTGQCPSYRVHGWIRGRDAKQNEWLLDHGGRPPAYFVPQGSLQPLKELEVIHGRGVDTDRLQSGKQARDS